MRTGPARGTSRGALVESVVVAAPGAVGALVAGPVPDVGPRLPGGIPSVLGEDACARAGALPPARPTSWLPPAVGLGRGSDEAAAADEMKARAAVAVASRQ